MWWIAAAFTIPFTGSRRGSHPPSPLAPQEPRLTIAGRSGAADAAGSSAPATVTKAELIARRAPVRAEEAPLVVPETLT